MLTNLFAGDARRVDGRGGAGDGRGGRRQVAPAPRVRRVGAARSPSAPRCCSASATRWARARRSRCSGARSGAPPASTRASRSRSGATSWSSAWRRHVDREVVPRVAAFLGELAGVPFPDEDNEALRARAPEPAAHGRRDAPRLGGLARRRVRRAPGAAGARGPALGRPRHGRASSTRRCATCATQPLMVLALARPEVDDALPRPVAGARRCRSSASGRCRSAPARSWCARCSARA